MKKALIFYGGWDGHEPAQTTLRMKNILENEGFKVDRVDSQEPLANLKYLMSMDLIIPCWTMAADGRFSVKDAGKNISLAVSEGVGLAGWHGGMCDAFRQDVNWQFMTGGQWVSHPGGGDVEYTVNVSQGANPIVEGISDFPVKSEQYYVHIDPAIEVLATTRFPSVSFFNIANKPVDVPVVWTKMWGLGRVFYSSLGHLDSVFDNSPSSQVIMTRGMLWAAGGKKYAKKNGLTSERFQNQAKMY